MLFTTTTQWVVLALLLVAGWLFGLASHPGGRKWKARYAAERDAHAAHRKEAEARIAEARKDDGAALTEARARIAELERENTRLANAAPVTASTLGSHDRLVAHSSAAASTATTRPLASAAARPAYAPGERRGWFEFGPRQA